MQKKIGVFSALFIAMGATLGTGIATTQGSILYGTGSALIAVVGWIIAGLIILPQMMIQGEMVSAYPNTGGPYVFFKKAKLKSASFMYGWAYAIWGWPFSIAFRAYVTFLFLDFFIKSFLGTSESFFNPWTIKLLSAITICFFGLLNYYSVKFGALINNLLSISKILLLAIIIMIAFTAFNPNNFSLQIAKQMLKDNNPTMLWFKGLAISVALAIWSYNGINTIAYMAPEFKNPQKTLPLVMIFGIICITLIYSLFVIAIGGLLSAQEAIEIVSISENKQLMINDLVLKAIQKLNLDWVVKILIFLIFLLSLSTVFTFTKVAPRLPYAMAKDGLFFKSFTKLNRNNIPIVAFLYNTIFSALLCFIPYNTQFIIIFFTTGTAIVNLMISLLIIPCQKNFDYKPFYKIKYRKFVLILSIISCLLVIVSGFYISFADINKNLWLICAPLASLLSLASAYPVYYLWQKYQKRQNKQLIITENK